MPEQKFQLVRSPNYTVVLENVISESAGINFKAVEVNWFPVTLEFANLMVDSIQTWLNKDYYMSPAVNIRNSIVIGQHGWKC